MARPREFDETRVLDAARDAFWKKGYEATSTRELVKRTGLTQPSLYNAFGDKRMLFRRALDHYLERTLRERILRLEAVLAPGAAISAFFGEVIERSLADVEQRGCMLVNSALEVTPDDEEMRAAVAAELAQIRDFFHRCLVSAAGNGELVLALPAAEAAAHLLSVLIGIRVLARVDPRPELLNGAASTALAMLRLPPLPQLASQTG